MLLVALVVRLASSISILYFIHGLYTAPVTYRRSRGIENAAVVPSSTPTASPAVSASKSSLSSTVARNWPQAPMVMLLSPDLKVTNPLVGSDASTFVSGAASGFGGSSARTDVANPSPSTAAPNPAHHRFESTLPPTTVGPRPDHPSV